MRRVGGNESFHVDVRLIAATNKNLADEVAEGNFREDLYYRVNVVTITLPPLRDRRGDIPLLAAHALKKFAHLADGHAKEISRETMEILLDYPWPGNVRQLESAIERAILLCDGDKITPKDLPQRGSLAQDSDQAAAIAAPRAAIVSRFPTRASTSRLSSAI